MLNKVQILGNVGQDPEIRSFQNGDRVASFSVATTEKWKDKQTGEQKSITEWHKVSAFGGVVNVIEKYVHKGSKVYVEGKLKTRSWDKPNGEKAYSTDIIVQGFGGKLILLDPKDASTTMVNNATVDKSKDTSNQEQENDFIDDEIPF